MARYVCGACRGRGPGRLDRGSGTELGAAVHTPGDQHGDGDGGADPCQAAATPANPAATDQPVHVGCGRALPLCLVPEGSSELLIEIHDSPTASPMPDAAKARRSAPIAADDCDFTVPGAQPRTSAICASVRSS